MERKEGRGRPGAPTKEQGGIYKESAEDTPRASPIEQKLSDKLSPTPAGEKKIEDVRLPKIRGAVFDCAVPDVVPSPFHIRRMLRDEIVTEEQAQELGQQWLGELKTMDRRSLEREVRWWETMRDRFTEDQKQEEVQELDQQLEVIREQLRQRGTD
jgi:hypothetical protein